MKGSKINSQIKARNFEIPAFGGFELTDYVPFLEEYFDIGHEVSCYSNVDECISLLKHWLKYDEEREFIRKRGEKKALNKNLYENRIQEIFATIKMTINNLFSKIEPHFPPNISGHEVTEVFFPKELNICNRFDIGFKLAFP